MECKKTRRKFRWARPAMHLTAKVCTDGRIRIFDVFFFSTENLGFPAVSSGLMTNSSL